MSRSIPSLRSFGSLAARRFRDARPTLVRGLCLLALLCVTARQLGAQTSDDRLRISVKHVLNAAGNRSTGYYTSDVQIRGAITEANTVLANSGIAWRFLVMEIVDVPGISSYHDLTDAAEMRTLEAAARANPAAYAWSDDAINIYVVNDILSGSGGICSFPMTDEIVVINNVDGLLNWGVGWLHEIGHYLSLTHTFEDCHLSTGAGGLPVAGSPGNAGLTCTQAGATHTGFCSDIQTCSDNCPDTVNVMSYNSIATSAARFTACQRVHMENEVFQSFGSRRQIWVRLLCLVNNTPTGSQTFPSAVELWRNQAVLHGVRDNVLSTTPLGERWTNLYYQHGEEMVRIARRNPGLRLRFAALITLASPGLAALAAGGDGAERVKIPGPAVALLDSVLNTFAEDDPTSPLARTIREERARLDLKRLAGRSYAAVWKSVNRDATELEAEAAPEAAKVR